MRRSLPLLAALAVVVIALDRWTKHWATATLPFSQPVRVVGDYLRLTYTRNSGVAFGIGQGTGFPYYVFSLVAIVAIVWMFLRGREGLDPVRRVSLALILGGAVGNLVDRVTSGEVVDFMTGCNPRGPLVVHITKLFPKADCTRFDAFGRIISGTIRPGDRVRASLNRSRRISASTGSAAARAEGGRAAA